MIKMIGSNAIRKTEYTLLEKMNTRNKTVAVYRGKGATNYMIQVIDTDMDMYYFTAETMQEIMDFTGILKTRIHFYKLCCKIMSLQLNNMDTTELFKMEVAENDSN